MRGMFGSIFCRNCICYHAYGSAKLFLRNPVAGTLFLSTPCGCSNRKYVRVSYCMKVYPDNGGAAYRIYDPFPAFYDRVGIYISCIYAYVRSNDSYFRGSIF